MVSLPLRDFLSSKREWHALGHGLYAGASTKPWRFGPAELPENEDVQAEPHYFKLGAVIGTIMQWVFFAGLARGVFAVPPEMLVA